LWLVSELEPDGKVFPFHSSSIPSLCAGGCWFSVALAFSARLMSGRERGRGRGGGEGV